MSLFRPFDQRTSGFKGSTGVSAEARGLSDYRPGSVGAPTFRTPQAQPVQYEPMLDKVGPALSPEVAKVLSGTLMDVGMRMVDDRMKLEARSMYHKYAEELRKVDEEYYTLTGEDAVKAHPLYRTKVEQLTDGFVKSASPALQRHLLPALDQKRNSSLDTAARHSIHSNMVWRQAVAAADEQQFMKEVGDRVHDVHDLMKFVENSVDAMYFEGDETQRTVSQMALRDKAYSHAVESMAQQTSAAAAMGHFELVRHFMSTKSRTETQNKINSYMDRENAETVRQENVNHQRRVEMNRNADKYLLDQLNAGASWGEQKKYIEMGIAGGWLYGADEAQWQSRFEQRDSGISKAKDPEAWNNVRIVMNNPRAQEDDVRKYILSSNSGLSGQQRIDALNKWEEIKSSKHQVWRTQIGDAMSVELFNDKNIWSQTLEGAIHKTHKHYTRLLAHSDLLAAATIKLEGGENPVEVRNWAQEQARKARYLENAVKLDTDGDPISKGEKMSFDSVKSRFSELHAKNKTGDITTDEADELKSLQSWVESKKKAPETPAVETSGPSKPKVLKVVLTPEQQSLIDEARERVTARTLDILSGQDIDFSAPESPVAPVPITGEDVFSALEGINAALIGREVTQEEGEELFGMIRRSASKDVLAAYIAKLNPRLSADEAKSKVDDFRKKFRELGHLDDAPEAKGLVATVVEGAKRLGAEAVDARHKRHTMTQQQRKESADPSVPVTTKEIYLEPVSFSAPSSYTGGTGQVHADRRVFTINPNLPPGEAGGVLEALRVRQEEAGEFLSVQLAGARERLSQVAEETGRTAVSLLGSAGDAAMDSLPARRLRETGGQFHLHPTPSTTTPDPAAASNEVEQVISAARAAASSARATVASAMDELSEVMRTLPRDTREKVQSYVTWVNRNPDLAGSTEGEDKEAELRAALRTAGVPFDRLRQTGGRYQLVGTRSPRVKAPGETK